MRGFVLLATIAVFSPAAAQQPPANNADFGALVRHANEAAMLFFVVGAASACNLRPDSWRNAISGHYVQHTFNVADALPRAMVGGPPVVRSYLNGNIAAAETIGLVEGRLRGADFCRRVGEGVTIRYLDTLVSSPRR